MAKAKKRNQCVKGYSCGMSCITRSKKCRNVLSGQANDYATFLKKAQLAKDAGGHGGASMPLLGLEDTIRKQRFESLAVFDDKGNQLDFIDGAQYEVALSPEQINGMKGQIVTHNHPRGWDHPEGHPQHQGNSFSREDVEILFISQAAEMRAVSIGHRYSIKPGDVQLSEEAWDKHYSKLYDAAHSVIKDRFTERINNGTMTVAEANVAHCHAVMELFTLDTGLLYEQVEYISTEVE